jgi:hypothetical protein
MDSRSSTPVCIIVSGAWSSPVSGLCWPRDAGAPLEDGGIARRHVPRAPHLLQNDRVRGCVAPLADGHTGGHSFSLGRAHRRAGKWSRRTRASDFISSQLPSGVASSVSVLRRRGTAMPVRGRSPTGVPTRCYLRSAGLAGLAHHSNELPATPCGIVPGECPSSRGRDMRRARLGQRRAVLHVRKRHLHLQHALSGLELRLGLRYSANSRVSDGATEPGHGLRRGGPLLPILSVSRPRLSGWLLVGSRQRNLFDDPN